MLETHKNEECVIMSLRIVKKSILNYIIDLPMRRGALQSWF